jgi:hypothetical protein
MSTLRVDRIEPYLSSSVSIEGAIQANAATTGSNTFVGDQNIQGTLTASLQDGYVWVGGAGNISTLAATSSFGGGGGSGDGFPFTGSAEISGSLGVTGSVSITGELSVTPALLPNAFPGGIVQYIIPFLSGSTNVIARDIDNALYWQPAFNVLAVSASNANTTVSPTGLTANSSTTGSTQILTTRVSSNFGPGRNISIAGDAGGTGLSGLTGITNPSIILQSGSAGPIPQFYAPIQFQASQSFTDGRVTVTRPLVLEQGGIITGSLTASVITFPTGSFGNGINLFQDGLSQIRFYSGSTTTEVGTWVNMQVNPVNGALAISSFPSNNHFIDFDVATTSSIFDAPIRGLGGNLKINSNTTITGSLTISGSANNDLIVEGRQSIIGKDGFAPSLTISGSSHRNTIGQRTLEIGKPGFDYPIFLSQYTDESSSILLNFTENLSATASYTVGVFDNAFTQDVELLLETTTTNGVQFKDISSDTGVYTTFLKIAPNGGTNPPLEFKRSAEVTGSVSISDVLQLAQKDPLPTGAVGQLAVSASNLYYNNGATWTQIN